MKSNIIKLFFLVFFKNFIDLFKSLVAISKIFKISILSFENDDCGLGFG